MIYYNDYDVTTKHDTLYEFPPKNPTSIDTRPLFE